MYNEPTFILRRTIIGCQALDYPNKKIYLLDDTRRQEMAELATELQCEYITEWFDLRRVVKLTIGDNQTLWGVTTIISERGAEIALTQTPLIDLSQNTTAHLEIAEENLQLGVEIIQTGFNNEYRTVRVKYTSLSLTQHRRLVKMLFCRPEQWKRNKTPGKFQSFLLIFRILLKPRVFFDRNIDVSPVAVAKI